LRVIDDALNRELVELRAAGASPIDAIKLIRERSGVSLGEAKIIFANHPAWADVHERNQPLHDAAEEELRNFAEPSK
jgi:ribosomal protein L7/L12